MGKKANDTKVDICNQLNYFYKTKDQGHLSTFVLDASFSFFLSSLKLLGRLNLNYIWSLCWRGNESLSVGSGSHDQDGHHAHIHV